MDTNIVEDDHADQFYYVEDDAEDNFPEEEDIEIQSEEIPENLRDTFYDSQDENQLTTKCTRDEITKLVSLLYLKHNLSFRALEDIFFMLNTIFDGKPFTESKYCFKKLFFDKKPEIHICCSKCQLYLGKKGDSTSTDNQICSNCNESVNSPQFFIYNSIRNQINDILEANSTKLNFNNRTDNVIQDIQDVHDGTVYKKLVETPSSGKYITLTINTDGAKVFKSKKAGSLWPIQGIINELIPDARFEWENLILIGLWFGKDPDMHVFLRPLVNEINEISENPIMFEIDGIPVQLRVTPLVFPVDTVARCMLQEHTQYNGYYGCGICLHPGI